MPDPSVLGGSRYVHASGSGMGFHGIGTAEFRLLIMRTLGVLFEAGAIMREVEMEFGQDWTGKARRSGPIIRLGAALQF